MLPLLFIAGVLILAVLLWRLAGWSVAARQHGAYVAFAAAVLVACAALVVYGLYFSASAAARPRFEVEQLLGPTVLPLFLALPIAVCILASQLLLRTGVSSQKARVASVGLSAASAAAAPSAALIAGCGLAGACL